MPRTYHAPNQAKLQIQPTDPRSTREGNWDTLQGHQYSISPDKFEMISARELSLHAEIKNQNPGNVVNENNRSQLINIY